MLYWRCISFANESQCCPSRLRVNPTPYLWSPSKTCGKNATQAVERTRVSNTRASSTIWDSEAFPPITTVAVAPQTNVSTCLISMRCWRSLDWRKRATRLLQGSKHRFIPYVISHANFSSDHLKSRGSHMNSYGGRAMFVRKLCVCFPVWKGSVISGQQSNVIQLLNKSKLPARNTRLKKGIACPRHTHEHSQIASWSASFSWNNLFYKCKAQSLWQSGHFKGSNETLLWLSDLLFVVQFLEQTINARTTHSMRTSALQNLVRCGVVARKFNDVFMTVLRLFVISWDSHRAIVRLPSEFLSTFQFVRVNTARHVSWCAVIIQLLCIFCEFVYCQATVCLRPGCECLTAGNRTTKQSYS